MPETRRKGRRRTHENPRPSPRAGAYAWGGDSPAGYRGRKAKGARRSECALPLPETGHGTGAGHCHLPPATLTASANLPLATLTASATCHAHWPPATAARYVQRPHGLRLAFTAPLTPPATGPVARGDSRGATRTAGPGHGRPLRCPPATGSDEAGDGSGTVVAVSGVTSWGWQQACGRSRFGSRGHPSDR
jgi:hypothetical protein